MSVVTLSALGPAVHSARAASAASSYVEAWGYNGYGTLGTGSTTSSTSPVTVVGLSGGVTAVAGGDYHNLAMQNGGVYSWGYGVQGQLGNGSNIYFSEAPGAVTGLSSGVSAIAAGGYDGLALKNGAIYAWGDNFYGELGNNSSTNSLTPVAVSGLSSGVTAIAAGYYQSLAVQNGAAYNWGLLGDNITIKSAVPVAVTGLTSGVTAVAGGEYFSLALKNGGVFAWGANAAGQLGNNSTTDSTLPVAVIGLPTGVTAIAAGLQHGLAVKNGNVYAWGSNGNGELGDGTTTNHLTAEQIDPTDLTNIIAVAANNNGEASYALSSDGTMWDWGLNQSGQLGLGTTTFEYLTPQHLLPPTGYMFISIAANDEGAVAVLTPVAVPEPASVFLLGLGALLLLQQRRLTSGP